MKKPKLFQQILMKKVVSKTQNFYILFLFFIFSILLITIALLIDISIYCYLLKYQVKQKQLLSFHVTNNELKEIMY